MNNAKLQLVLEPKLGPWPPPGPGGLHLQHLSAAFIRTMSNMRFEADETLTTPGGHELQALVSISNAMSLQIRHTTAI